MAATLTEELILRFSISFIGIAAARAFAATVARVNRVQGYAVKSRLVLKKVSQLRERPVVMPRPLALSNRYPLSDALEVFNGYRSRCVFSLQNESLADDVIRVALEAGLSARQLFEFARTCACAFALQVAAAVCAGGDAPRQPSRL